MQAQESGPVQTIRLSDKEKTQLVQAVNSASSISVGRDPDRLYVTASNTNALLTLADGSSKPLEFSVIAYSHGRWGISLIHGRYVHPNTRCKVRFQSLNGEWHERAGHSGQCIHVQGLIHAMLVVFDEPINLDEFALLTPDQETQHLREIANELPHLENEEFQGLVSRVLYVEDQQSDRKLVSHWLNRAGMQVSTAPSAESALQQCQDSEFDLIIIDIYLKNESGIDLSRSLRNSQIVQPILLVTADENPEVHEQGLDAGANHCLVKPLNEEGVIDVAKRLMGDDQPQNNTPIYSSLSDDTEMVPLLTGYVRNMAQTMHQLRHANGKHDYDTIERLTSALKGSGESYGYPEITASATSTLSALRQEMPDIDAIKQATSALICLLNRVRLKGRETDASEGLEEEAGGPGSEADSAA